MRKMIALIVTLGVLLLCLTGCDDSPIQDFVVSGTGYTTQEEIDKVVQSEMLSANEAVFATVSLIESPKGMEYTVNWYIDGSLILSETKATVNNQRDIVVYELVAENVTPGLLKVEIVYRDTVLATRELTVE